MIRETSLDAYNQLVEDGRITKPYEQKLGKLEEYIFHRIVMLGRPFTDSELTNFTGMKDERQCPRRRYDLLKKGLLVKHGTGLCPITSRKVIYWRLSDKGEQYAGNIQNWKSHNEMEISRT